MTIAHPPPSHVILPWHSPDPPDGGVGGGGGGGGKLEDGERLMLSRPSMF